mgnify:CR=1 FL=1
MEEIDRGLFKKTTITQTMVKKWLAGDKVRCNKLMGKNDTEFKADVIMKYNPDSVYNAPDLHWNLRMTRKKTHLKNNRDVSFLILH